MLFNSPQFALFLLGVLALVALLPRRWTSRLLLGSSLVFYGLWIPSYLVLLLMTIVVNYGLLRAIGQGARARLALGVSIVFTLGLLAAFKYGAMLVMSALPLLKGLGLEALPVPDLFLPLGISFYSFQIIALSIDTYRGRVEPVESFGRYALFVCFFPQLIAGPIVRGRQLLPQLERGGQRTPERTRRGIWLLASGVVKKMLIADFLLAGFVDEGFTDAGVGGAVQHWVCTYSFAFQIYFDFSGYTDMARGMAKLLGFELPFNFKEPYLSRNPAEFWRRWHITLSQWLRDYLYISIGGNRQGTARTYLNLFLTMLLGGLWHGAAWTFVAWGGLHGLMLGIHRAFARKGSADADRESLAWRDVPRILLLFHAVCVLWVFFRAADFDTAFRFLAALVDPNHLAAWPVLQTGIVLLCAVLHVAERGLRLRVDALEAFVTGSVYGRALEASSLGILFGLTIFVAGRGAGFIYFQF